MKNVKKNNIYCGSLMSPGGITEEMTACNKVQRGFKNKSQRTSDSVLFIRQSGFMPVHMKLLHASKIKSGRVNRKLLS